MCIFISFFSPEDSVLQVMFCTFYSLKNICIVEDG